MEQFYAGELGKQLLVRRNLVTLHRGGNIAEKTKTKVQVPDCSRSTIACLIFLFQGFEIILLIRWYLNYERNSFHYTLTKTCVMESNYKTNQLL